MGLSSGITVISTLDLAHRLEEGSVMRTVTREVLLTAAEPEDGEIRTAEVEELSLMEGQWS